MNRGELERIAKDVYELYELADVGFAYIGNVETEYDQGEHQHKCLIIIEKSVREEDLARFPKLKYLIIYDQRVDANISIKGPPSLLMVAFECVRFVNPTGPGSMTLFTEPEGMESACDVRVQNCVNVPLAAFLAATNYPGVGLFITDSHLTPESVTVETDPDGSVHRSVDIIGWQGTDFFLTYVQFDSPTLPKVRVHDCPNLDVLHVRDIGLRDGVQVELVNLPFMPHDVVLELSSLPLLEQIESPGDVVISDVMPCLALIEVGSSTDHMNAEPESTIVGLENCPVLGILKFHNGPPPDLLCTISQLISLTRLQISGRKITNLNGCEFLVNLRHLNIGGSCIERDLLDRLHSNSLSDEELRGILWQIDPSRTVVTSTFWALKAALSRVYPGCR